MGRRPLTACFRSPRSFSPATGTLTGPSLCDRGQGVGGTGTRRGSTEYADRTAASDDERAARRTGVTNELLDLDPRSVCALRWARRRRESELALEAFTATEWTAIETAPEEDESCI
jgi:hypothetical protein